MVDAPAGGGPFAEAGLVVDAALAELASVASAARGGDQLAAAIVNVHAAGFVRLLELATQPAVLTDDAALAELFWVHTAAGDAGAIEDLPARIDALRSAIEQTGVPGLLDAADRLVAAVLDLYGWAFDHAVAVLHDAGDGDALRAALDDPLVGALLLAHGLHPEPLAERVAHALASCTSTLGEHVGRVELVDVSDDGAVRVAITGGDEQQRWRTRLVIERAIRELVPDVVRIEVDGAAAEPRGTPGPTIIPITSIGRRQTARWLAVPGAADLGDGDVLQVAADGVALLACRVGDDWFVARDPFSANSVVLVATDPPTVEAGDGTRFSFTDPLSTHVDGGVVEVLVR
jgi:hypothetical protein